MHDHFMRAAITEAQRAEAVGEVPIGAVVVVDGAVVAAGGNASVGSCDPTAHAEIVALRAAGLALGNYRLTGASLYVTVEPCLMCVGALVHARIDRLVYGSLEPKAGAVQSMCRALDHPALNHRVAVVSGVLEGDCSAIVQRFFRERRVSSAAVGSRE